MVGGSRFSQCQDFASFLHTLKPNLWKWFSENRFPKSLGCKSLTVSYRVPPSIFYEKVVKSVLKTDLGITTRVCVLCADTVDMLLWTGDTDEESFFAELWYSVLPLEIKSLNHSYFQIRGVWLAKGTARRGTAINTGVWGDPALDPVKNIQVHISFSFIHLST